MTTPVYFTSMSMFLGTVVLAFGMISYAIVQRGRASQAQAEAYRRVAEQAAGAEAASAAALATIRDDLADMRTRLAGVEKVLNEVG